jgi:hypothetical protein
MTLSDALRDLESFFGRDMNTIYAQRPWSAASLAYVAEQPPDGRLPESALTAGFPTSLRYPSRTIFSSIANVHSRLSATGSYTTPSMTPSHSTKLFYTHAMPNQALQRMPRSCHIGFSRTSRAISESSLSLRSLGDLPSPFETKHLNAILLHTISEPRR